MWSQVRIFADARGRRATIALLLVAVAVFVGLSLFVRQQVPWLTDPRAVRAYIRGFGPFAPAAFFLLQSTQVVVAPVPGHVLGLVSGYLFGAGVGTVISVSGAVLGSYIAFVLSRRFGRPFVESVIDGEALRTFDEVTREHGLLALFLVFLVPGLPDDVICFAAGLTDLRMDRMVAVSLAGRIPGFYLVNLAGANLADGDWLVSAAIVAGLALVAALVYVKRGAVLDRLRGESGDPT